MSKYTGFSPKELEVLRQNLPNISGFASFTKKDLENILEATRQDYLVTHQVEIDYYNESVEKLYIIMNSHPQIVYNIGVVKTKSYGTEQYIEFAIQLASYSEWFITDEIEYLIKNKLEAS